MTRFYFRKIHSFHFGVETWAYILFALFLGFAIPQVNILIPGWISPVDKATMTTILSSIASGMITLTGIVFSLVFVLLQFGSVSYSPRITRLFAHSIVLRHSLGIFTGTFLYSLMALRMLGMSETGMVSGLTVWVGFLWLIGSIFTLANLIQVFTTLTITNVLTSLGRIGRISLENVYKKKYVVDKKIQSQEIEARETTNEYAIIYEGEPGYINDLDIEALLDLAIKNNVIINIPYFTGDALKNGTPVANVNKKLKSFDEKRLINSIQIGGERIFKKDPKYSLRLLVDTAIRALSPAINDPSTAVQALDHIESLLLRIGQSDLDVGNVPDTNGIIRVKFKTPTWEDYLQLGLSEIMQYGAESIQVERRLESLFQYLIEVLPMSQAEKVKHLRNEKRLFAETSFVNPTFKTWANIPDREGIGSSGNGLISTEKTDAA